VAVVDSAVDTEHPELAGRVSVARDFVEPGGKWKPEVHGTAVAGVIAAAANNREGIFGIAPDAEIAALRACWSQPTDPSRARCTSFTLARAVEAAIVLQAEILNLSLSGPPDPLLERLIDEAVSSGIIVV